MANEVAISESRRSKGRWSLVVAAILSVIFLTLALRGVAWAEVIATFRRMRLLPFAVAVPVLSISYLFRGLRWAILLRSEAPLRSMTAVWASLVGYLANGFLPARAGEPIRAALVSRNSSVSISSALATALTERLVDAAILTLIAVTAVASAPSLPEWLRRGAWTMAIVASVGIVSLFVAPRLQPLIDALILRLPVSKQWKDRLSQWSRQFLQGLRALHSSKRALSFLAFTVLIWTIDTSVALTVARTVDLALSFPQALALLSALGLATAAPSTPGYLGIYQFVAVSMLEPCGATRSQALVFIIAFQAVVYTVITIGGGSGLWALSRETRADANSR